MGVKYFFGRFLGDADARRLDGVTRSKILIVTRMPQINTDFHGEGGKMEHGCHGWIFRGRRSTEAD